jgi:hypothetical protein
VEVFADGGVDGDAEFDGGLEGAAQAGEELAFEGGGEGAQFDLAEAVGGGVVDADAGFAGEVVAEAADWLARHKDTPVAEALRIWGNDDANYFRLMNENSPGAAAWRETVAKRIAGIKPMSRATVWRGWHFGTKADLDAFAASGDSHIVERPGMSASTSEAVAQGDKFLSGHGLVWEIRKARGARDFAGIFKAIGTKYSHEAEVIFPKGTGFKKISGPEPRTIMRDGKPFTYLHAIYEEH